MQESLNHYDCLWLYLDSNNCTNRPEKNKKNKQKNPEHCDLFGSRVRLEALRSVASTGLLRRVNNKDSWTRRAEPSSLLMQHSASGLASAAVMCEREWRKPQTAHLCLNQIQRDKDAQQFMNFNEADMWSKVSQRKAAKTFWFEQHMKPREKRVEQNYILMRESFTYMLKKMSRLRIKHSSTRGCRRSILRLQVGSHSNNGLSTCRGGGADGDLIKSTVILNTSEPQSEAPRASFACQVQIAAAGTLYRCSNTSRDI